ncbi:MAG TPA: hypothetical protein PLL06_10215, partial [Acidobacteriota bacterium]|nr:hypothetical protein [Acidobacteriota bacterium]
QIVEGTFSENMVVNGHLDLSYRLTLKQLPKKLQADSLDLSHCTSLKQLPEHLVVNRLILNGCTALERLPEGLRCFELDARNTPLSSLPQDLSVTYLLNLEGCSNLKVLPTGLKVGSLIVRGCSALQYLPEHLDVCFLDISGCTQMIHWPSTGRIRFGRLLAAGCDQITSIPEWVTELTQLDIRDCAQLTQLPHSLQVRSWIDVANTGIQSLPVHLQGVQLRWRGVPITEQIAFQPDTITAHDILDEPNIERRRIMMERIGHEKFLSQTVYTVLDQDEDPGGERQLLRVEFRDDENLVCLSVFCPSTGRQYMIRVPPKMESCHQAAAWIAGFDNPNDYFPVQET